MKPLQPLAEHSPASVHGTLSLPRLPRLLCLPCPQVLAQIIRSSQVPIPAAIRMEVSAHGPADRGALCSACSALPSEMLLGTLDEPARALSPST